MLYKQEQHNYCFLPISPSVATVYFLLKYGLRLGGLLIDRISGEIKGSICKKDTEKQMETNSSSLHVILPITGFGFQQSNLWTEQEDQSE